MLQGYGVTIDLVGTTFISKAGITVSTFKTVPDEPVTSFELTLPEGPYCALTALGNLCTRHDADRSSCRSEGHGQDLPRPQEDDHARKVKKTEPATLQMPTEFVAQNGAELPPEHPDHGHRLPEGALGEEGQGRREGSGSRCDCRGELRVVGAAMSIRILWGLTVALRCVTLASGVRFSAVGSRAQHRVWLGSCRFVVDVQSARRVLVVGEGLGQIDEGVV